MKKLIILFLLAFTFVNAQIELDGGIKKVPSLWKLSGTTLSPNESGWLFVWDSNQDKAFRLSDNTNIAHGMTSIIPTGVYFYLDKESGSQGGVMLTALSEAARNTFGIRGIAGDNPTTTAVVFFRAGKKSGTSAGNLASTDIAYEFQNYSGANFFRIWGDGRTEFANKLSSRDSLTTHQEVSNLADSLGTITLATGVAGWGEIMAGDNQEWASFRFSADGTVTLITNTANVSTTENTVDNLNIFDNGSGVKIQNNLGASKKVAVNIKYFTP